MALSYLGCVPCPAAPPPERSVFSISASNGVDMARRLTLLGFCYSAEQLFERVEDTVLARGGEVWETQRQLKRCASASFCVAAWCMLWMCAARCPAAAAPLTSCRGLQGVGQALSARASARNALPPGWRHLAAAVLLRPMPQRRARMPEDERGHPVPVWRPARV